jgi:hypothetical protein
VFTRLLLVLVACLAAALPAAHASRKTVCTITVNSPDEKELMQRTLPKDAYRFVELVEHGRPDWLASACRNGVRCDVLVISGHFDGGTQFYSDRLHVNEYLPVDEMERVACSDACPGLFSQLKEVYLFGCNTLNDEPMRSAGREIERSLVRSGWSPSDAAQLAKVIGARHAESNRERMRNIFKDVPVIYGFSSKAPLGPYAAQTLQKYFHAGGAPEIGSGRPSAKLLGLFAPVSMLAVSGATDSDQNAGFRRDVCRFADERLSKPAKLAFVHELLKRDVTEVRMLLDHLERHVATLTDADRRTPEIASVIAAIGADARSRARYLEFARDADEASVRARMIELAHSLGWLDDDQRRTELARMIDEHLGGKTIGAAQLDLFCALGADRALAGEVQRRSRRATPDVAHAAVMACAGHAPSHARVLAALTSADDRDVEVAQVYLRHRPIASAEEMRSVTRGIAKMVASPAQVRALDTLASQPPSDVDSLEELARLFASARSPLVQRAIAGILLRADYRAIARPDVVASLRQSRVRSVDGADLVDVLLRRLERALAS